MITAPSLSSPVRYVCIPGRQPILSVVELEQVYGSSAIIRFGGDTADAVIVETSDTLDIERLGGITRAGRILGDIPTTDWNKISRDIIARFGDLFANADYKVTLGISVYGNVHPRDIQRTGIQLKSQLKKRGVSMRLIPNEDSVLSTATSHHNKLGLSPNKREIIVVVGSTSTLIADSTGSQNITALARRDQGRPKRDAFVGMLPPKLALMMVNMSGTTELSDVLPHYVLDPFCGTGVVLQEAALLGYDVYGSDLSEKMVDYSTINLEWLKERRDIGTVRVEHGDATDHIWNIDGSLAAVVGETYLGQPFSAPPTPDKLQKVVSTCDGVISSFLRNLATQIAPETPLCIAVPAWRASDGSITKLPLIENIDQLGYRWQPIMSTSPKDLLYYREDQVVARQLLILEKA